LRVDYGLELEGRDDKSEISWYRCSDGAGSDPVAVAVSRLGIPEAAYTLSPGDIGYYIAVAVSPRHIRSPAGESAFAISASPIAAGDLPEDARHFTLETDFRTLPTTAQPVIKAGFVTLDGYKPADTSAQNYTPAAEAWVYAKGQDGAADYGLLQNTRGARLLYTPPEGDYGDMSLSLTVDPEKQAGQGFGSATDQYMDVYIKYDTATLSGYALRIQRTTRQSNGVEFSLLRYDNGVASRLTEPVRSSAYLSHCTISLEALGTTLRARVTSSAPQLADQAAAGLLHEVDLIAEVPANAFGGTGVQHTGTNSPGNRSALKYFKVTWD
jgi:hypothetical protein